MAFCRESAIWALPLSSPDPLGLIGGLIEVSCLGLDQDAVADQMAGDQLFDWGLWLAAIRLPFAS